MARFLFQRIGLALLSIWAVCTITFFIAYLAPGDPAEMAMGQHSDKATLAHVRHEFGLDKPPLERYGLYLWGVVHGDLGTSYRADREPVVAFLKRGLPNTALLAVTSIGIALVLGIVIGLLAALRPNSFLDRSLMATVLVGVTLPSFVLAPVLIGIFALKLGWLPVEGWGDPTNLVLPAVVLAARPAALIARMTRASMLETLRQDYIRTARAKGLSPMTVLVKHALKNAFLPVLTTTGVSFGYLLSGSFVVETIFGVPGVGKESVASVFDRNYPLIQGTTLLLAGIFVVTNLVIDLLTAVLDPRIKTLEGA